jgi:hypothetical protein
MPLLPAAELVSMADQNMCLGALWMLLVVSSREWSSAPPMKIIARQTLTSPIHVLMAIRTPMFEQIDY